MSCCCQAATTTYGYAFAGVSGASLPVGTTTCDKINFTAETIAATTTGNLTYSTSAAAGAANPGTAGYIAGGVTDSSNLATLVVTADKITFSNDTTSAATTANLSQAREELAALSERSTKAYFAGGGTNNAGALTAVNTADVLTFSGDSTSAVTTANLSQSRKAPVGLTEGTSKGYFAGGFTLGAGAPVKTADKVTFSGDSTAAATTANLSASRFAVEAGSDGSTKGYWASGNGGAGAVSTVDKLTFSTDTTAVLTSASLSRTEGSSGSDGTKFVTMSGGTSDATGNKITFATDAVSSFTGSLSVARQWCCGFAQAGL